VGQFGGGQALGDLLLGLRLEQELFCGVLGVLAGQALCHALVLLLEFSFFCLSDILFGGQMILLTLIAQFLINVYTSNLIKLNIIRASPQTNLLIFSIGSIRIDNPIEIANNSASAILSRTYFSVVCRNLFI
jgi:hypothetical protein